MTIHYKKIFALAKIELKTVYMNDNNKMRNPLCMASCIALSSFLVLRHKLYIPKATVPPKRVILPPKRAMTYQPTPWQKVEPFLII